MNLTEINEILEAEYALDNRKRVIVNNLVSEAPVMNDKTFWKTVADLKKDVDYALKTWNDAKNGVDNFFCHWRPEPKEALSFVRTYELKVNAIYSDEHYDHLSDEDGYFCGDDSWGDLCDSFPLNGEEVYNAFLNREIDPDHDAFKNIQENYIRMRLNEKLPDWLKTYEEDEFGYKQAKETPIKLLENELQDAKYLISDLTKKLSKVKEAVS
jgi:hypothetical protein